MPERSLREFALSRAMPGAVSAPRARKAQRLAAWALGIAATLLHTLAAAEATQGMPPTATPWAALASSSAKTAPTARLPRRMAADFHKHVETRLPTLKPHFERAAAEAGLDWKVLAALGYQESRWLARAQSPAGAQGVMMLMPETARKMGVKNTRSPAQNIRGGARYLALMKRKIPQRIRDPDRTWLALAAYNIGLGHLENARIITQMRGKNPDRWADVRASLPLLSEPAWHSRFALGYARGEETAQLVERVFQFATVLDSIEQESAAAATDSPG
jgi:membrane-bound lytic murein transglycosylase F